MSVLFRSSAGDARTVLALVVALSVSAAADARDALSDAQVRQAIIQQSVAAYHATGKPCACPYDQMRNGTSCGSRSAYSKPGGASPLCFPGDVSDAMVRQWRGLR